MTTKSMRIRLCVGLLLLCCAVGCSPPPTNLVCGADGVSDLRLDPHNQPCQKKCDCSNQNYEGACLYGKCFSRPRESCPTPGESIPCTPFRFTPEEHCKGIRICQEGTLRNQLWGDCKPQHTLEAEQGATLCGDGIDNDCDGKTDGDDTKCPQKKPPTCKQGEKRPCYNGPGDTVNKGICVVGVQRCDAAGAWGACEGEIKPAVKEVCNAKDDDCDGSIDEDFAGLGEECTTGVGACVATGKKVCKDDGTGVACDAKAGPPATEVCDGKDNDCNGKVDDVTGGKPCCKSGETRVCFGGIRGCVEKDGKYTCEGVCAAGKQTCTNSIWGACQGALLPSVEECNGKDDDCDGLTDEGDDGKDLAQPCYPAGALGCNVRSDRTYQCFGVCKAGTQTCQGGLWGSCKGFTLPSQKSCGSSDEDCDGKPDLCVETLAGSSIGFRDGPALQAQFNRPLSIAVDAKGALFIAEHNGHRIRKLSQVQGATCGASAGYTGWCVETFAGNGTAGKRDGPIAQAQLYSPHSLLFDAQGNLTFSQWDDHRLRQIRQVNNAPCGSNTNYTGLCVFSHACSGGLGYVDGAALQAKCYNPAGLYFDARGALLFADQNNHRIRKLEAGKVTTFAGGGLPGNDDGVASAALFNRPNSLLSDAQGALHISDYRSHKIRKMVQVHGAQCGTVANYTGWCVTTFAGAGSQGFLDGPAAKALFNGPHVIISDGQGAFLVADYGNHRIRKIAQVQGVQCGAVANYTGWCVTTLAGSGVRGGLDGPALQASFFAPSALALSGGYLYIVEHGNHRIRRVRVK